MEPRVVCCPSPGRWTKFWEKLGCFWPMSRSTVARSTWPEAECGSPHTWIPLSEFVRSEFRPVLATSRLLPGGLTQSVATNGCLDLTGYLMLWVFEKLTILFVPCILEKQVFCLPLLFGSDYIKPLKHKCGQIWYSLGCLTNPIPSPRLSSCIFF